MIGLGRVICAKDAGFSECWIIAASYAGQPYLKRGWVGMPKIPAPFLKCVFYLYSSVEDAKDGKNFGGTGFLIGVPMEVKPGVFVPLAVSNWHVVVRGHPVIRLNKFDGGVDVFDLGPDQWEFVAGGHDVAIAPLQINEKVHDVRFIDTSFFVGKEGIQKHEIGPGENVFMAGRFIDLDGGEINVPALRFGNISMMPQQMKQENGAVRDNYLIDVHSRTGFSGSPVFVYRTPGEDLSNLGSIDLTSGLFLGLLGIHWGQVPEYWELSGLDAKSDTESRLLSVEGKLVKGWSGMTCVAPTWAILETIEKTKIKNYVSMINAQHATSPGTGPVDPVAE